MFFDDFICEHGTKASDVGISYVIEFDGTPTKLFEDLPDSYYIDTWPPSGEPVRPWSERGHRMVLRTPKNRRLRPPRCSLSHIVPRHDFQKGDER